MTISQTDKLPQARGLTNCDHLQASTRNLGNADWWIKHGNPAMASIACELAIDELKKLINPTIAERSEKLKIEMLLESTMDRAQKLADVRKDLGYNVEDSE